MMRKDLTEIAVVLDRSGSMVSVREDTIGGFNTFLEEQKKGPGDANFTMVQFDTEYEVVHSGKPIGDVPPLTDETFVPRGLTALHDAIGRTIHELGSRLEKVSEVDRPGQVVVVIITDGLENSSVEYKGSQGRDQIAGMIKHQEEKYSWEFIFLGSGLEAALQAQGIGIQSRNMAVVDLGSKEGSDATYTGASSRLMASRTGSPRGKMSEHYASAFKKKSKGDSSDSGPPVH